MRLFVTSVVQPHTGHDTHVVMWIGRHGIRHTHTSVISGILVPRQKTPTQKSSSLNSSRTRQLRFPYVIDPRAKMMAYQVMTQPACEGKRTNWRAMSGSATTNIEPFITEKKSATLSTATSFVRTRSSILV